jgi:hypothetical protein
MTREGGPTMVVKAGGGIVSSLHHGSGVGSVSSHHSSKHGTFGAARRIVGSRDDKPRRQLHKKPEPVSQTASGSRGPKDRDEFQKGERE